MIFRLSVLIVLIVAYCLFSDWYYAASAEDHAASAMGQLNGTATETRVESWRYNSLPIVGWLSIAVIGILLCGGDMKKLILKMFAVFAVLSLTGCKPYEPVQLETIQANEEAFMLPLLGEVTEQTSSNTEDYLRSNLVFAKQVKVPQQWVKTGRMWWDGDWRAAALVIKVDKSPVTREWTADPNSGTSDKNEAIWVMTSDQVEFSTGWTCTARIASRDDAVKFLYNYPNGSLEKVMDTELRAKLQAEFGLEVTDLPMDTLRKAATPHITDVTKNITEFFKTRGINITNIGITGGFVYKDPSIMRTMVEVFNAEQEKTMAKAATEAQDERNKKLKLEAEAKSNATLMTAKAAAEAILAEKQAEAEGIKSIADAKLYEIEKAKADLETYLALKHIEIQQAKLEKWDGRFPSYYMGNSDPDILLQVPNPVITQSRQQVSTGDEAQ